MESQEPKPKKDIGLTTIELEIPETYIDDDNFFSKSISWKRRLKIVEKVLIVFMAIIAIPLSAYIASWIDVAQGEMVASPLRFNPFSEELWSITILPYILSFIILIACEFFFKNISLTKGVLKTTCYSLILSVLINVTTFTLCTAFRQAIINSESNLYYAYIAMGAIDGCVYTFILLVIRLILKVVNKSNKKRVIIVGPKEDAQILSKKMIKENKKQCTIRYVFYEEDGQISDDIYTKVKKVNTIILLDSLTAKNKQALLLYFSSCKNKDIFVCSSYFDIVFLDGTLTHVNEKMAFEQRPLYIDSVEAFVKRAFDIIVSLIALICLSPIMLLTALLVKCQDGGPVFYKQTRLTKGLKPFEIYKFRSMRVDAEKIGGAQLASENDPRITKIGRIIRATRIDELPQIINILKGDMSWVGPRPERPEFVYGFIRTNPLYRYRYNVKAGLTGLQQVSATYHTSFEDKLKYDLYYIQNQSTIYDLIIIFKTVGVVFQKSMAEGADPEEMALPMEDFLDEQDYTFKDHGSYLSIFKNEEVEKQQKKNK